MTDIQYGASSTKTTTNYLNPHQVAHLCFDEIVPEIPNGKPDMRGYERLRKHGCPESVIRNWMKENHIDVYWIRDFFGELQQPMEDPTDLSSILVQNETLIRSVIVNHQIDSFKVQQIDPNHFANFMENEASSYASKTMVIALSERMKSMNCTLKWDNICNAVKHEMSNVIAQSVSSVLPHLKPIGPQSGDELIAAIKTKAKRSLTVPEEKYLRSLIQRATDNIPLIPFDDHSYSESINTLCF